MFAMVLPFVIMRLSQAKETRQRVLYAIAAGLVLAGGVATLRKTAVPAFGLGLLVLTVYRPRQMVRLLPLGALLVLAIHLLAPGALSGLRYELTGGSEFSNQARLSDYAAVEPDIAAHPVLGRGYGTYDPRIYFREQTTQRHRILDNQYLLILIETGIVGLLLFVWLAVTAMITLHRTARSRDPARAGPAIAVIAGVGAFALASALFDTLAFPQVPYMLFFLLALGAVARVETEAVTVPRRRMVGEART
jgi:O-antigen ligase